MPNPEMYTQGQLNNATAQAFSRGFEAAKAAAKRVIDFAKIAACVEEKMSGDNKCRTLVLAIESEIEKLKPEGT